MLTLQQLCVLLPQRNLCITLYPEQSEALGNSDGASPRRCLTCVILVLSWQMKQCKYPKHKIKKTAVGSQHIVITLKLDSYERE